VSEHSLRYRRRVPAPPTTDGTRRRAPALAPDDRRRALIRATLPLLLVHGEQVTTRQIADAAGVAEGTIFRVFADKDELLDAVVDAALDPAPLEEQLADVDVATPLEDAVEAAVTIAQQRVDEVWRLVSSLGSRAHARKRVLHPESPALVDLFEAHSHELGVSPCLAARSLRSVTFALSHPMLIEQPVPPAEITRLLLRGVTGAGAPSDAADGPGEATC
jgi:AcrR family transcriptional regulator